MYADGSHDHEDKQISINLAIKDIDILEKIQKALKYEGTIKRYLYSYKIKRPKKTYEDTREYCELIFHNNNISNKLNEIGMIQNKSLVLTYPTTISNELHKHFIRGYVDGDGCLYHGIVKNKANKNPDYRCIRNALSIIGTEIFLNKVNEIFDIFTGIKCKTLTKANYNDKMKYISFTSDKCKTVLKWIYGDSKIYSNRKHAKYLEIINS